MTSQKTCWLTDKKDQNNTLSQCPHWPCLCDVHPGLSISKTSRFVSTQLSKIVTGKTHYKIDVRRTWHVKTKSSISCFCFDLFDSLEKNSFEKDSSFKARKNICVFRREKKKKRKKKKGGKKKKKRGRKQERKRGKGARAGGGWREMWEFEG